MDAQDRRALLVLLLSLAVLLGALIASSGATATPPEARVPVDVPPGSTEPGSPGGGVIGNDGTVGGIKDQPCGVQIVEGDGPDAAVSYEPCPNDEPPAPLEPRVVEPSPATENPYPRPYDSATVQVDDVTVFVDFWSGIEPCYVLDHVDVAYGTDAVTITLFEGSDPTSGAVACIEIAEYKRVVVTLAEPLGDRRIVDGAAE